MDRPTHVTHAAEPLEPRRLLAAIASDQTIADSISALGEADEYTFDAAAGDSIVVALGEVGGDNGTFPRLELFGPDGASLAAEADNFGLDLDVVAPQAGVYRAVVSESGDDRTMDYRITLAKLPGPQSASDDDGGPIESGQTFVGTSPRGDLDVYPFSAAAGDSIVASLGEIGGNNGTFPRLDVYGPDGARLGGEADNFGVDLDLTAPQTGTYYALVRESGGDASIDYRVSLAVFPSPLADDPLDADGGPIESGERIVGRVDRGEMDVYTFDAGPGDSIVAAMGEIGGNNGTFVRLDLYGPDGARIGGEGDNFGVDLDFTAPQGGTYSLLARESGSDASIDYRLSLAVLPGAIADDDFDADGGPIDSNRTLAGTIDRGDLDVYHFDASPGDNLVVSLGEVGGNNGTFPRLDVYGPDGARLAGEGDNFGVDLDVIAPQGGTFYAVVRESGSDSGMTYQVSLARLPGPQADEPFDADGGVLLDGVPRGGSTTQGDLDVFTFTASAGDPITVNANETRGDNGTAVRVDLYGPDGAKLGGDQGNTAASVSVPAAPQSGTYYALVREPGGDATNSYTVALNAPAGPDVFAPRVAGSRFVFEGEQAVEFVLSERVTGLDFRDFEVRNLTTGATFAPTVSFDGQTNTARLTFPDLSGDVLPDGDYRVTFEANGTVVDNAGNALADEAEIEFFVLAGDFNRDRSVNLADFTILANNFGREFRLFSQGDANLDGRVNLADFTVLANAFGNTLPAGDDDEDE